MKHYFMPIEKDPNHALNSLWAVLYEGRFLPEVVHIIIIKDEERDLFEDMVNNVKTVTDNYDMNCEVEAMISDKDMRLEEMIENRYDDRTQLVLDISGASKNLTAKILSSVDGDIFDKIYSLEIHKSEEKTKWYPQIDSEKISVVDLKKDKLEGR